MNIYQIDRAIMDCIDETGEVLDLDQLMALQMEREQKCENIACWIINLNAEAAAIKAQEQILKQRRDATDAKAKRLKEYLTDALGGEKLKTSRVSVSYRRSTAVDIAPDAVIPEEYTTVKVTAEPDKTAIKNALNSGVVIPGCAIVERNSIQIK